MTGCENPAFAASSWCSRKLPAVRKNFFATIGALSRPARTPTARHQDRQHRPRPRPVARRNRQRCARPQSCCLHPETAPAFRAEPAHHQTVRNGVAPGVARVKSRRRMPFNNLMAVNPRASPRLTRSVFKGRKSHRSWTAGRNRVLYCFSQQCRRTQPC
jgi:hypothetical protein